MGRINLHVTRQRQDFVEQRIVELDGQRARVGLCVAQVGPTHVIDEQQVAREQRSGLATVPDEEA